MKVKALIILGFYALPILAQEGLSKWGIADSTFISPPELEMPGEELVTKPAISDQSGVAVELAANKETLKHALKALAECSVEVKRLRQELRKKEELSTVSSTQETVSINYP